MMTFSPLGQKKELGIAVKALSATAFKLLTLAPVRCKGDEGWRRGCCWRSKDKSGRLLENLRFRVPLHSGHSPKPSETVVVKFPAKSRRNSHHRLNEFLILLWILFSQVKIIDNPN